MGPTAYVGVPGSEKTKQALAAALEESKRTGWPILAVDPGRVWNFNPDVNREWKWPHAPTVAAVVNTLWEARQSVAWTTESMEEFDRVMEAARAAGRVIILIDEVRWFASAQFLSRPLSLLARTWRHAQVSVFMTTQRFGDLHQDLVACLSALKVFRCSSPRDLERLTREFGMNRDAITALEVGQSIPYTVGFPL